MGIFSSGSKYGKADDQAKVITPPRAGNNVLRDIIATPDIIKIPDAWTNKWLTLTAFDNNAFFMSGKTLAAVQSMALTATPVNGATKVVTLSANTPGPLPNGLPQPFYCDATEDAFLAVMAKTAGGIWVLSPSSPTTGGT